MSAASQYFCSSTEPTHWAGDRADFAYIRPSLLDSSTVEIYLIQICVHVDFYHQVQLHHVSGDRSSRRPLGRLLRPPTIPMLLCTLRVRIGNSSIVAQGPLFADGERNSVFQPTARNSRRQWDGQKNGECRYFSPSPRFAHSSAKSSRNTLLRSMIDRRNDSQIHKTQRVLPQ